MPNSSRRASVARSPVKSPLFTLGSRTIGHATRQWEREATAPRKRTQRKGTKVWKRPAHQNQDALVSAQLLNDLASSVEAHAAKRQRTKQIPAVPVSMQTESSYAPTLSDVATPGLRRKAAGRRKSARSPQKAVVEDSWLSPTKRVTRRRSSIKPLADPIPSQSTVTAEKIAGEPDAALEPSFLEVLDLSGSKMFGEELDDENSEVSSDREGNNDDLSHHTERGEEDICSDDGHEALPGLDDSEDESTARLVDAGHTGVLQLDGGILGCEDDLDDVDDDFTEAESQRDETTAELSLMSESAETLSIDHRQYATESLESNEPVRPPRTHQQDLLSLTVPEQAYGEEDLVSTQTLTEDFDDTAMQEHVSELLRTPPKETEHTTSEAADNALPTMVDDFVGSALDDQPVKETIPTSSLEHQDSISTVAFEDMDVTGLTFGTVPAEYLSRLTSPPQNQAEMWTEAQSPPEEANESKEMTRLRGPSSPGDDESADELFAGTPTLHKIVFSPNKAAPSVKLSPAKNRPGPRLSDDTTYLNDFLSRVRSQAAARSLEAHHSPVKISTPQKPSRIALGEIDANSTSPSPAAARAPSPGKEKPKSKPGTTSETGSPTKLPRTPVARLLLANNLESPETPDELVGGPTLTPSNLKEDSASSRRSGRSKLTAPSRLPLNAPSNIPLRRADGDPPVLQRSDAQKLARTTAANTRRNKGGARFPKQVIESLEGRLLSPVKGKGVVRNRKGQNVDWDHRLVYYLEDTGKEVEIDEEGRVIEKENGKEVHRKVRIVKGERVESSEPPVREEVVQAAPVVRKEDARSKDTSSKTAKSLRRVKVATAAKPAKAEEPAPKSAVPIPKTPTTSRRRVLEPPASIKVKGTPAARRVLSVETAAPSAARRATRRV